MKFSSMALLVVLAAMPLGCVLAGDQPPVQAGDGLKKGDGKLEIDPNEVPVLPSCDEGQIVGKGSNGWECFTPATPETIQAGAGIAVENGTVSFNPGTIPATDAWNGTVPYANVTGAPAAYTDDKARAAVTWPSIRPTVSDATEWPGTIPYGRITDPPAPYTDDEARAAVGWPSIKGSVQPTDSWPGVVAYSQVVGAPNVPPPATWSIVQPSVTSSTEWPGTVPYARVTGAPAAATWSSISSSISNTTEWPGTVPYGRVSGAPAAATWSSIASSVTNSTAWPGTVDYSHVNGAPEPYTDARAQAAVTWTTVAPTVAPTDPWPGTMDYSHLTNVPNGLDTVTSDITMLNGQMTSANSDISSLKTTVSALQNTLDADVQKMAMAGPVYELLRHISPSCPAGSKAYGAGGPLDNSSTSATITWSRVEFSPSLDKTPGQDGATICGWYGKTCVKDQTLQTRITTGAVQDLIASTYGCAKGWGNAWPGWMWYDDTTPAWEPGGYWTTFACCE